MGHVLAVLDDLLFTSKLRATAKHLGVALTRVASSADALAAMRADAPSLVILDLDNPRTDPLGLVAAMKDDPALAAIPIAGFVSHTRTDLITAARKAGVDDVLARSAFVDRLPALLRPKV